MKLMEFLPEKTLKLRILLEVLLMKSAPEVVRRPGQPSRSHRDKRMPTNAFWVKSLRYIVECDALFEGKSLR